MNIEQRVAALESLIGQLTTQQDEAPVRIDELATFSGVDTPDQLRLGCSNMKANASEQVDGDSTASVLNGIVTRANAQSPIYGKMNTWPNGTSGDFTAMANGQSFGVTCPPDVSFTLGHAANFWIFSNPGGSNDAVWVITKLAGTVRFLVAGVIPPTQP